MFKKLITVYNFFNKKNKRKLLLTQFIAILSSIFETLSILSVGPLVQILSDPNSINNEDQLVSKVYNFLNFSSLDTFLLFIVFLIFIFFLITVCFTTFNTYLITVFAQHLGNDLRSNLFKFYLSQPWLYHARTNSSDLTNKIIYETGRVTNNVIFNILMTNSKLVTGLFIIIFLTVYNVKVSITAIAIISLMYFTIFVLVKKKMEGYGKSQSKLLSNLFKLLNESLGGIKETIIYGKQKIYFDDFTKVGRDWGLATAKIIFLTLSPRNILEFLAFSIVLVFIVLMVFNNETNFNNALPSIAIYIFAGYKLLPIFQGIYQGLAQFKGNAYAIENINYELNEGKKYSFEDLKRENNDFNLHDGEVLSIRNVSFSYIDSEKAVKNINLEIKEKTLNFIVGPSGSGKSTLLDLILGLISPQVGEIIIGKNQLSKQNNKSWHKNLGYVGQNIFLIDDTIKNNICLSNYDKKIDIERFNRSLILSNVDKFLKNTPNGVETIVGERGLKLSGGQRQRIAIARALYQNKKFLILDEATASLDGISEKFIIDNFKELSKNITIIMATHNVKLCKNADKIFLLDDGSIKKSGIYEEMITEDLFRKLLNE